VGKRWNLVLLGLVVVAAALAAVAILGFGGGGSGDTLSTAEYQTAVVNARDRVDFAFERVSQSSSEEELLQRMEESGAVISDAAGELDDVSPPEQFEDANKRLVRQMRQLSADLEGTAAQAREVGFESLLSGAAGLSFDSWDVINTILGELAEQGVEVEPLERH
jgi:hypothetical protein